MYLKDVSKEVRDEIVKTVVDLRSKECRSYAYIKEYVKEKYNFDTIECNLAEIYKRERARRARTNDGYTGRGKKEIMSLSWEYNRFVLKMSCFGYNASEIYREIEEYVDNISYRNVLNLIHDSKEELGEMRRILAKSISKRMSSGLNFDELLDNTRVRQEFKSKDVNGDGKVVLKEYGIKKSTLKWIMSYIEYFVI